MAGHSRRASSPKPSRLHLNTPSRTSVRSVGCLRTGLESIPRATSADTFGTTYAYAPADSDLFAGRERLGHTMKAWGPGATTPWDTTSTMPARSPVALAFRRIINTMQFVGPMEFRPIWEPSVAPPALLPGLTRPDRLQDIPNLPAISSPMQCGGRGRPQRTSEASVATTVLRTTSTIRGRSRANRPLLALPTVMQCSGPGQLPPTSGSGPPLPLI